jgi:hypothetical protein
MSDVRGGWVTLKSLRPRLLNLIFFSHLTYPGWPTFSGLVHEKVGTLLLFVDFT